MTTGNSNDPILANKDRIHEIPLAQIEPDKEQLRKEFSLVRQWVLSS